METDDLPDGTSKVVLTVTDGNGGSDTYDLELEVQGSASSSLLIPIAIAAILAVIIVVFLLARSRGKADGPPAAGTQVNLLQLNLAGLGLDQPGFYYLWDPLVW